VDHAGAATALCDVSFTGITGYGVLQKGGALFADAVSFWDMRRDPQDTGWLTGSAVALGRGVSAKLRDLVVRGSEGSALLASGPGATTVTLEYSTSFPSHPAITGNVGCWGAVAVATGASLTSTGLTLDDNAFIGVNVIGSGAADMDFLQVTNTRNLTPADATFAVCGPPEGLANAVASVQAVSGGTLAVSNFLLDNSDFAGVAIYGPPEPTVHLSNGVVSNNPVGATITIPGYDVAPLEDNVQWVNNDVTFDSQQLNIPEPEQDLDSL
jgi:hypothetical protein